MRPIGQVGWIERSLGVALILFTGGLAAAFVAQATAVRRAASDDRDGHQESGTGSVRQPLHPAEEATLSFPDPGVPGWVAPAKVSVYTRENLYTKIDGAAPAYVDAGFVALTFGAYASADDARRTIDVYCYDMGRSENAEHMFRAEAPPGTQTSALGQGAFYVQVLPGALGEADASAARSIAGLLAGELARRSVRSQESTGGG